MITYNQEKVIDRTMASLLCQKHLYEICVSDDCSSDRTWAILNEYSSRYPGLFKLRRNDPNIGIFSNEEQTWGMPDGDIIYRIAGDDECCEGYFERVADYIAANGIDWEHELFCIVGNNITRYPDGNSVIISNVILENGHSPLKLKLRGLLNDRSACFSSQILRKYIPVSKGRSFVVEEAQDDQLELFADRFYYIDAPGNIYYSEYGISSNMSSSIKKERIDIYRFFESFLASIGHSLDSKDRAYTCYKTCVLQYSFDHRLSNLIRASFHYIRSIDLSLGKYAVNFRHLYTALNRKLIHGRN